MDSLTIKEIYIGDKPKRDFDLLWKSFLMFIITLPFRPLTLISKSYTTIDYSDWEYMFEDKDLRIEKKQVAANRSDDCIPFYLIASTDNKLNDLIRNKYFGAFICKTKNGFLLRQFKSPKKWPKSRIIFVSMDNYMIKNVKTIYSNFPEWIGYFNVNYQQIDIPIENMKDYKKILRLIKSLTPKK